MSEEVDEEDCEETLYWDPYEDGGCECLFCGWIDRTLEKKRCRKCGQPMPIYDPEGETPSVWGFSV